MNSIIWNGVSSTTIQGLLISELPPITKPEMRVLETVVDGRDGSIIEELGYTTYKKTVTIGLHGNFDINKVIKYFTGEGELIFSNEPDKVYKAKICGKIDYTRLLRFRQAKIPFEVQPFKYKYNEYLRETQTATASGTNIILNDCANAPMRIETEADKVIVHGKNIFDAYSLNLNTNTSLDIQENGYKITAIGGTKASYASSKYDLPLSMAGKSYCIKFESITTSQDVFAVAQIIVFANEQVYYHTVAETYKTIHFTVPIDVTKITMNIITNHTNEKLETDNVVTITGLSVMPIEYRSDAWTPFVSLQEATVEDGVAILNGIYPLTVISNAENTEMTVEYFKSFEVFNEGLEDSKPLMILKGSGTVEISVNGVGIFSYTFPEGENEVIIDSEKEDAYLGNVLKNRNMIGEFPILLPKTNIIGWSGNIESISILPRSRWL